MFITCHVGGLHTHTQKKISVDSFRTGSENLSCKGQIENVSHFINRNGSVTATQQFHCNVKTSRYISEQISLCFNETLFIKARFMVHGHNLPIPVLGNFLTL